MQMLDGNAGGDADDKRDENYWIEKLAAFRASQSYTTAKTHGASGGRNAMDDEIPFAPEWR